MRKSSSAFGHCLHSVVGEVQQPLVEGDKSLVINGEIYNWKQLDEKYQLNARNDSELLFKLLLMKGENNLEEVLDEVDGVFAFAFQTADKVYLVRDLLGVKPLWYEQNFAFASEKKVLENPIELNPRHILVYDKKENDFTTIKRDFFQVWENHQAPEVIIEKTKELLIDAVRKRANDEKVGLLFSGGVDSVFLAFVLKQLGVDFNCYTVAIDEPGLKESEDLYYAQKAAEAMGLNLKVKKVKLSEIEGYLNKVTPLIEDNNVVKVGVGLVFYIACEKAKEDGIKVMFSGLGSEEIFAGYERHLKSSNINEECLSGLRKMYERDLYRDDVVSMNNQLELRLPLLDKKLVKYALGIPKDMKINEHNKWILRKIAYDMGVNEELAFRKKRAAQYGSKTDKAIQKLARKSGYKYKSEYLKQFYEKPNVKLAALISTGKDSLYAMYLLHKQNYEISCLLTLKSKNPDSYMFHTPNISLAKMQAEALGLPIIEQETTGDKEGELKELEEVMEKSKEYGVQGIVTGAIHSNYQRERIEKVAENLGLKVFAPLWRMDQEHLMRQLLREDFEFILSSVAAYGLDKSWLGKKFDEEMLGKLVKLNDNMGINIAGEGGEFESLVLDMPLFKRKIEITDSEITGENEAVKFFVKNARLVEK